MDYRRSSLVLNRQQLAHMSHTNSHIYASFAGTGTNVSPNTNADLSEATTMWWDEQRIEATVTKQYVVSKLHSDEAVRLEEPLRFGDSLTDDSYWEWIQLKAKRIFLILVELGVPDQIFGVVDDSWDDDDLPIPLDQVERLQLTFAKDEKLERRFFHKQFSYLLRHIQKGDHVIYDDDEVVPLEIDSKRLTGSNIYTPSNAYSLDKVHAPGKPDDLLYRRKIPLGGAAGHLPHTELLSGIEELRVIEHPHLTSLWASYVHQDHGYLLFTPVQDSNLKSFLTVQPQSIKIMTKQDRRLLLLNWLHCLSDALSFLHSKGFAHQNIKPSTIMLDIDNDIFFSDIGIFSAVGRQSFDKESYDYSAPELAQQQPRLTSILVPEHDVQILAPGGGRRSTAWKNGALSSVRNSTFSTHGDSLSITSSTGPRSPALPPPTVMFIQRHALTKHDPQKGDIFSLGAIFLEVLTVFVKKSSNSFRSHRGERNKTPGRGGGLPDASFHKNLGQVETWMNTLSKEASKKEDKIFRSVKHIVALAGQMLLVDPDDRPTAATVQERLYVIMKDHCGLASAKGIPSKIHCDALKVKDNEWNFGFDELRLASQRAAAEACAAVAPQATEVRTLPLGNGGVIYGIEKRMTDYEGNVIENDSGSIGTKSSEGKASKGSGCGNLGKEKSGQVKPRAKAWKAPVYAGLCIMCTPVETS